MLMDKKLQLRRIIHSLTKKRIQYANNQSGILHIAQLLEEIYYKMYELKRSTITLMLVPTIIPVGIHLKNFWNFSAETQFGNTKPLYVLKIYNFFA